MAIFNIEYINEALSKSKYVLDEDQIKHDEKQIKSKCNEASKKAFDDMKNEKGHEAFYKKFKSAPIVSKIVYPKNEFGMCWMYLKGFDKNDCANGTNLDTNHSFIHLQELIADIMNKCKELKDVGYHFSSDDFEGISIHINTNR